MTKNKLNPVSRVQFIYGIRKTELCRIYNAVSFQGGEGKIGGGNFLCDFGWFGCWLIEAFFYR